MNVLSLFDGISCGRIALERAGIEVDNYFASEIDKYAIQVSKHNYPDIIHLGDINDWETWKLPKIDLIIGGSPCQGFSFAGKGLNFDDPRSKLFFKFVDIVNHYKPKYFMLENVKMKKESENVITKMLGVEPIEINSALVSAQNRVRKYWTNIQNLNQPEDKKIFVDSILESGNHIAARRGRYIVDVKRMDNKQLKKNLTKQYIEFRKDSKSNCLTTVSKDNVVVNEILNNRVLDSEIEWRYLTRLEYERLQTVPEGYTNSVSESQAKKMLGNGWTVDVIVHILKNMEV